MGTILSKIFFENDRSPLTWQNNQLRGLRVDRRADRI